MVTSSWGTFSSSSEWNAHLIASNKSGSSSRPGVNLTWIKCQKFQKFTRRILISQMCLLSSRKRLMRRVSLQKSPGQLMISWESKEISKKLTIEGFNKRNRSWTTTLGNLKINTKVTKTLLRHCQTSMRVQSRKKCSWSSKRIDLLPRSRTLNLVWPKSRMKQGVLDLVKRVNLTLKALQLRRTCHPKWEAVLLESILLLELSSQSRLLLSPHKAILVQSQSRQSFVKSILQILWKWKNLSLSTLTWTPWRRSKVT